jgi:hypothetical protein
VFVPVRLFTDAERTRLNRFPRDISPADLLAFFSLSDAERPMSRSRHHQAASTPSGVPATPRERLGHVLDQLLVHPLTRWPAPARITFGLQRMADQYANRVVIVFCGGRSYVLTGLEVATSPLPALNDSVALTREGMR